MKFANPEEIGVTDMVSVVVSCKTWLLNEYECTVIEDSLSLRSC